MGLNCTRCEGTGFLNMHQLPQNAKVCGLCGVNEVLEWIKNNEGHDIQVCDCCGNGEDWYDIAGEHYNDEDPKGNHGPYAYNGGLCECN